MKERGNFWLRFLDKYVGILILSLLYLAKKIGKRQEARGKMAAAWQSGKSFLVIKIFTIGDTLLLMPVLKAIKDKRPEISLTVIGSKNNYEVLNRYPFIDDLKVFEVSKIVKQPSYFFRFMKDVNRKDYDVVMDFEAWPRISAIVAFFVGTGSKTGFKTKGQFRHTLFDNVVPHNSGCHEIENYISLANAAGISVLNRKIEFPISDSEKALVEEFFKKEKLDSNKLVLFHPWSSGYNGHLKEWGVENFARLAKLLADDGYFIGITGTKDNEPVAQDILRACPENVASFCGKFTLGQTAYLIKKSRFLITVNTGIMHLGAALNHPMIALHGPAGVLRWGPVGSSKVCNIESNFSCAPCLNLGFDYKSPHQSFWCGDKCKNGGCMDAIKVETVARKVSEIINKETAIVKETQPVY